MNPPPDAAEGRAGEIAEAVGAVRERIARACTAAGRSPEQVRLVAVTKTFPAADAAHLVDLGCLDLGEAKEQEASAKVAAVATLRPGAPVRWTVLGRLQRNKSRAVVRWAAQVQSVDSDRLAAALDRAAARALDEGERRRPLEVLVQISLDGDPGRGGCAVDAVPALADLVAGCRSIQLRGVMVVAPQVTGASGIDAAFARTREVADQVRASHPGAVELSAGMSGDLETAIRHGSTCVRVGTALLGSRPLPSAGTQ